MKWYHYILIFFSFYCMLSFIFYDFEIDKNKIKSCNLRKNNKENNFDDKTLKVLTKRSLEFESRLNDLEFKLLKQERLRK
jgi:hypothetical protein